ncbi:MAG: hypothetical protein RIB65_01425 [Ilumatobacter fluminis]|uniref:hypothetical protein n=1 Tax=Ilumatobacter fluminis TaxID=467091 RepID=UPI0032EAD376
MSASSSPTPEPQDVHPLVAEPTAVRGTISSVAFESGDRFVVGNWHRSPVGRLVDVMWVTTDGTRRLLVNDERAAEFITSIYAFDEVHVAPLTVDGDATHTHVSGHGLQLSMTAGRRRPIPFPRPRWVTRWVEAPIARWLMGVETYGVSPTGVREWYQSRGWSWITEASGTLDGVDLGEVVPIRKPVGVGFSDPPERPSIVTVHVAIHPPER